MTNDEKFLENITIGLIKIRHEVEKLDMENARLRDALKQIADQNINPWCATAARAALEGKE